MSKNVVITGSTQGIGRALAAELAKRGHAVVVSGRKQETVDAGLGDVEDVDVVLDGIGGDNGTDRLDGDADDGAEGALGVSGGRGERKRQAAGCRQADPARTGERRMSSSLHQFSPWEEAQRPR